MAGFQCHNLLRCDRCPIYYLKGNDSNTVLQGRGTATQPTNEPSDISFTLSASDRGLHFIRRQLLWEENIFRMKWRIYTFACEATLSKIFLSPLSVVINSKRRNLLEYIIFKGLSVWESKKELAKLSPFEKTAENPPVLFITLKATNCGMEFRYCKRQLCLP